jgi:plastocyanin
MPLGSSEAISLNSTSAGGITVNFSPSTVQLQGSANSNVTLTVSASKSSTPGNFTIRIQGVSGAYTQTASVTVRVVQNLVFMIQSAFSPVNMNVTVGSAVFWQNLDGPAGGCAPSTGSGVHNVVFTTLLGVNSSTMNQFDVYSYTFTTAGSYFYYSSLDTDHLMNGTITVMGADGAAKGIISTIPAFSYFKGGSTTTTSATTTATKPISKVAGMSPVVAGGLALTGLVVLNAHPPTFSVLAFEAGPMVLLSLGVFGLALVMLTLGKRRLTTLGMAVITWLLPSSSS